MKRLYRIFEVHGTREDVLAFEDAVTELADNFNVDLIGDFTDEDEDDSDIEDSE